MTPERQDALGQLLNGETLEIRIDTRISLRDLTGDTTDATFYSLLVQAGYLALEGKVGERRDYWRVRIPNIELMGVWQDFILDDFLHAPEKLRTLLNNVDAPALFAEDAEYFLSDRLSYFDIDAKTPELSYHIFVLGILSAYDGASYQKPLSNREAGDGRYDVMFTYKDKVLIFVFKRADEPENLDAAAQRALVQIDEKRYFAQAPKGKHVLKVGVAFCGKQCRVLAQ
jgi:hypothetical protein